MIRGANPFAPPPPAPGSGPARGCLAALATAGAVAVAAALLRTFVSGTHRIARQNPSPWPATWGAPPSAPPPAVTRRMWGEIRARFRDTHRWVPA